MATASSSKKRKIEDERRKFNEKWTEQYFFVLVKERPVCLVCYDSVAALKEHNIKRHYEAKHSAKYDSIQGKLRSEKVLELKKNLGQQQSTFVKQKEESEASLRASYIVAEKLAKSFKPFSDGELIKECMEAVAEVICPKQKHLFSNLKLSAPTVTRRVEELAENLEKNLKVRAKNFIYFSVAMDEGTDFTDTAQLVIFIRGVDKDFIITEELAALFPMKGTTKGIDIFNALIATLQRFGLVLEILAGATTDGAPSMSGKHEGAVAHLRKQAASCGNTNLVQYHCILHQENLCAKSIGFKDVMKDVVKTVNFIRAHGLNHREFQSFLKEVDAAYGDVPYFTEVRWLSRGKVLKRVFDLREEIFDFTTQKGKSAKFFKDSKWLAKFAFLVDISSHLNELNLKLQGRQNLADNLYNHIKAFEVKLTLWQSQIAANNFAHFPSMKECQVHATSEFVDELKELKEEFSTRFRDFKENELKLHIFSNPFGTDVDRVPPEYQMELIEMQTDSELQQSFKDLELIDFYAKKVSSDKYPNVRNNVLFCASLFATTYICEQLFSEMKLVKSKLRNRLTDSHLEACLRISSTNLDTDIDALVKGN